MQLKVEVKHMSRSYWFLIDTSCTIWELMLACFLRLRLPMGTHFDLPYDWQAFRPYEFSLKGKRLAPSDLSVEDYHMDDTTTLTLYGPYMGGCDCRPVLPGWEKTLYPRADWRYCIGSAVNEPNMTVLSRACGILLSGAPTWSKPETRSDLLASLKAVLVALQNSEDAAVSTAARKASSGMALLDGKHAARIARTVFPWSQSCGCHPRTLIEYRLPLCVLERLQEFQVFDNDRVGIRTVLLYVHDAKRLDFILSAMHPQAKLSLLSGRIESQVLWQRIACAYDGVHFASAYILAKHGCLPGPEFMRALAWAKPRHDERAHPLAEALSMYLFVQDTNVLRALAARRPAVPDHLLARVFALPPTLIQMIMDLLLPTW